METLPEYINRLMKARKLSSYAVARDGGQGLTQGNVSRIAAGQVRNPSISTLKALAKGLNVSEEEIFAVARGASMESTDFQKRIEALFHGSENWTKQQQEAVYSAVKLIVTGIKYQK